MSDDGLVPLVLSTLRTAGHWPTRIQAGTARGGSMHLSRAGMLDILDLTPDGDVLFIECKRKDGKLNDNQLGFIEWCVKHGHEHRIRVVRSVEDAAALVEGGWRDV
mgnify:CR=1 FL=1